MTSSTDANVDAYRSNFAITESLVYLNHAAAGPLSRPVVAMLEDCSHDLSKRGSEASDDWVVRCEQTRSKVAEFIGAKADEIAFMKNTPDGINAVCNGIDWRVGDNVVTVDIEFPANIYPWMNLKDRGVGLRIVSSDHGCIEPSRIVDAIDDHTRVVALSWVEFHGGFRHDLRAIGRACRDRGVYLAVDGIQGLGSMRCNVNDLNVDFFSAASHKWMLGPHGVATLFVRRAILEDLRVAAIGVTGVEQGPSYLDYGLRLRPNARRFECGFLNLLGIAGLDAAVDLFNHVGMATVEQRVCSLTDRLVRGLDERGYRVYGPRTDESRSGVVSFSHPTRDAADLVRLLRANNVVVSAREQHVRVSPHFYNAHWEIDQLLDTLPGV